MTEESHDHLFAGLDSLLKKLHEKDDAFMKEVGFTDSLIEKNSKNREKTREIMREDLRSVFGMYPETGEDEGA